MGEQKSFEVGQRAFLNRAFTFDDIQHFAALSGDFNPVHMDEEFARTTRFGKVIVHGMLVASLISTLLGTDLPGPGAIYVSQDLRFLAPVYPGDQLVASVEVIEWDSTRGRLKMMTEVKNQDGMAVISGEAKLVIASYLK